MKSRKEISQQLGITEQYLSMLLSTGKNRREVSWNLADTLSEIFPGTDMKTWKRATPEELKRAFEQLETKDQPMPNFQRSQVEGNNNINQKELVRCAK